MSQTALYLEEKQGSLVVRERSIPVPQPGQILVRVVATALNPIDWKIAKLGLFLTEYPAILGWDGAGIVVDVGPGVTKFVKGNRVTFYGLPLLNYDFGTFQQYAVADVTFAAKVPDNVSLEQAASIPACASTAAIGLYAAKDRGGPGLQAPWTEGGHGKYAGQPIVILGGASSVGLYAIQFAKISGFSPIITTASLHNEPLLKSLGATYVVDRNAPLTPAVRAVTSDPIEIVFDAISLEETQEAGWEVLAPEGILMVTLPSTIAPAGGEEKKIVKFIHGLAHLPDSRTVSEPLWGNLTGYLSDKAIVPNPIEVLPGGLEGIAAGFKLLEENKVSGKKLVVKLHEE